MDNSEIEKEQQPDPKQKHLRYDVGLHFPFESIMYY